MKKWIQQGNPAFHQLLLKKVLKDAQPKAMLIISMRTMRKRRIPENGMSMLEIYKFLPLNQTGINHLAWIIHEF